MIVGHRVLGCLGISWDTLFPITSLSPLHAEGSPGCARREMSKGGWRGQNHINLKPLQAIPTFLHSYMIPLQISHEIIWEIALKSDHFNYFNAAWLLLKDSLKADITTSSCFTAKASKDSTSAGRDVINSVVEFSCDAFPLPPKKKGTGTREYVTCVTSWLIWLKWGQPTNQVFPIGLYLGYGPMQWIPPNHQSSPWHWRCQLLLELGWKRLQALPAVAVALRHVPWSAVDPLKDSLRDPKIWAVHTLPHHKLYTPYTLQILATHVSQPIYMSLHSVLTYYPCIYIYIHMYIHNI